jgi:DNA-binding CsgD family transcriptional regulator
MSGNRNHYQCLLRVFAYCMAIPLTVFGQSTTKHSIHGYLNLDDSWERVVYLSYIPTLEDLFVISSDMIIAKAVLDSLGYFEFETSFLPEKENLYRIHVTKKGDPPATLIMGGNSENYLIFPVSRQTDINLIATAFYPPFKNTVFDDSTASQAFQQVTKRIFDTKQWASESSAAKRGFIEKQLQKELLVTADTSKNPLLSLYAFYNSHLDYSNASDKAIIASFLHKWKKQNSPYFRTFRQKYKVTMKGMNNESASYVLGIPWFGYVLFAVILLFTGFVIGHHGFPFRKRENTTPTSSPSQPSENITCLSIQERKILELLKQGATNQEISDHFNIEISTVKSHVSRILSKFGVKSRKELLK